MGLSELFTSGGGWIHPANLGLAAIWDPSKGDNRKAIRKIEPPIIDPDGSGPQEPGPAPIYCSGQSLLPNGDVLITGGNLVWPESSDEHSGFAGIPHTFTFDPWTEEFTPQPAMNGGRWYPSQVLMGDGRTLVLGGFTEFANDSNPDNADARSKDTEVFSAGDRRGAQGSWTRETQTWTTPLYPHLYTLPSGDVLFGGPGKFGATRLFDPSDDSWSQSLANSSQERTGGTAVPVRPTPRGTNRYAQIGGFDGRPIANGGSYDPVTKTAPSVNTSEIFNAKDPEAGWKPWKPLVVNRSYQNTVLLPDLSMVTVGGGTGFSNAEGSWTTDATAQRRRVEVLDPETGEWRLGPSQREDRSYHSTAVLLPDGRVWSAGDDHHPYGNDQSKPRNMGDFSTKDTAEIYKPAYLFKSGKRPKIRAVSKRINYAARFGVKTAKGRGSKAVLIAPSQTTHAADMHQRLIPLARKRKLAGKGFDFRSPGKPSIAPPGYYMLFVLSGNGKPSVAEWVRLDPNASAAKRIGQL